MGESIPQFESDTDELHEVIKLRRHFHQYPEISFAEYWTSREICSYLSKLGYQINYGKALYRDAYPEIQHITDVINVDGDRIDSAFETVKENVGEDAWLDEMRGGFTGVIATLDCSSKGPTIGFRFDIDGLPIQESCDSSHQPHVDDFASKNENMHACGHDGHTAVGLALAQQIAEHKQQLSGRIVLVFQPSEEGPSGGELFSKFDIFKQLDYLIPLHVGIIDTRKIVCGLSFLSLKNFNVTFKGTNAHAAVSPEKGSNALLAACSAVNNLFTMSRHSSGITRINVGQFTSNNPTNVISDNAVFELELRGENNEISDYLYEKAKAVIHGAALMHGVEAIIEDNGHYVSAENSSLALELLKQASINAGLPEGAIIDRDLTAGSEDATFLMNEVNASGGSASYLGLGSPTYAGHHHPQFDFDEDMLIYGVKILWEFVQCVQEQAD